MNAAPAMVTIAAVALSACAAVDHRYPREDALTAGILLEEPLAPPDAFAEPARPVSPEGIGLTKLSEGFRSYLYNDAANYCTIGYGHLVKRARCDGTERPEYMAGLSESAASELLVTDMMLAQLAVSRLVSLPLSDGQYGALCDFVYNVGGRNFAGSTLLVKVNGGALDQVPAQMRRWVLANGKVYEGLRARREREITLFFAGLQGPSAQFLDQAPMPTIDIRVGEQMQTGAQ